MTNMATGAKDANGIYQYGEADAVGYFSDYMNLGPASVSAALDSTIGLKTSTQALTAGTLTGVAAYDSTVSNTLPGTWSASAGTFTATVAGTYRVNAQVEFAAGTATYRIAAIQKAVAATPSTFASTRTAGQIAATTTILQTVGVQDYVTVAVGDVLRLAAQSSVALNITNAQLEIAVA